MSTSRQDKAEIIELSRDGNMLSPLKDGYITDSYFEISVKRGPKAWKMELCLKSLENPLEKTYTGRLFEEHIEKPRAFGAILNGKQVG